MTGFSVEVRDLSVHYGETRAVEHATFDLAAGAVHGLLGRNGSGKTTALSVLASLRRPTAGTVLVDGEDPFENERIMERVCMIRESGDVMTDERISTTLAFVELARPTFDRQYADELLETFEIDPRRRPRQLSRGQRSALGAVIGLASRAPLTIFDEVYLGMDAPTRRKFYDLLLEDYVEHPRTIVLSSHLIDEIERLLERVVILERGGVLLDEDADSLRGRGMTVTGPADAVDRATAGLTVLAERRLGPTKETTVLGGSDGSTHDRLRAAGLELGPVGVEDLFIHLTGGTS